MAILKTWGPVHIYVAPDAYTVNVRYVDEALPYPAADKILYLGTCEVAPRVYVDAQYVPARGSIAGGQNAPPMEMIENGQTALITGTLTRWNDSVYKNVVARPNASRDQNFPNGIPGYAAKRGNLMVYGRFGYCVWLHWPTANKSVYTADFAPLGYRFPMAWMQGPDDYGLGYGLGSGVNGRGIVFYGHSVYERRRTVSGANVTYQSHFLTFDAQVDYLPTVPPTAADGTLDDQSGAGWQEAGFVDANGDPTDLGWTIP